MQREAKKSKQLKKAGWLPNKMHGFTAGKKNTQRRVVVQSRRLRTV